MRQLVTLTAAVALVTAFGFVGAADATHPGPSRYADSVASFVTDEAVLPGPHGPNAGCGAGDGTGIELNALGAEDAAAIGCGIVGTISLGSGITLGTGSITVEFTDNFAVADGTGADDLTVYDGHSFGVADETALVSVSVDGVTFVGVGTAINNPAASLGPFANDFDLDGAIPFVKFVRIINQGGVLGSPGFDVDAIEALNSFGTGDIVKAFADHSDDGDDPDEIFQTSSGGFDDQQFKAFTITITNNTGVDGGLSGLTFIDVVPAEFDLDPLEENDVNGCSGNAEVCDGVDVTAADDALTDCTATGAEGGAKGKGKGNQKLAPDVVTMTAGGLDDGDSCTITVWVTTDDDQPGRGRNPDWTPTSCPVTLNNGVKVFDASMNLLLQDDDSLIFDDNDPVSEGVCNEPV